MKVEDFAALSRVLNVYFVHPTGSAPRPANRPHAPKGPAPRRGRWTKRGEVGEVGGQRAAGTASPGENRQCVPIRSDPRALLLAGPPKGDRSVTTD